MSVQPDQDFSPLARAHVPLVLIDRPAFAVESSAAATRHLIEHGHRRIAAIGGDRRFAMSRRRADGWESAMRAADLPVRDAHRIEAPLTRAGGYDAARELLGTDGAPTAIYVESDAQAAGVLRAAADLGASVPGELAIVATEGTASARFTVPSLTSVQQPIEAIAASALTMTLSDPRQGGVRRIDNSTMELVLRESCGCTPTA